MTFREPLGESHQTKRLYCLLLVLYSWGLVLHFVNGSDHQAFGTPRYLISLLYPVAYAVVLARASSSPSGQTTLGLVNSLQATLSSSPCLWLMSLPVFPWQPRAAQGAGSSLLRAKGCGKHSNAAVSSMLPKLRCLSFLIQVGPKMHTEQDWAVTSLCLTWQGTGR